jgi:DNA-binding IclR family transcriptional regulator
VLSKHVYVRHTVNTIVNPDALARELRKTRNSGYALDDAEEELNVRCVAVPVFDDLGRFVEALSASGAVAQITLQDVETIVTSLQRTARAIGTEKLESDAAPTSA